MKTDLLLIRQLDKKMENLRTSSTVPEKGWIHTIRKTINMSLQQCANRLNVTPQTIHKLELSEQEATISLRSLIEVADAMEMKLIYGFVPKNGSLETMIDRKATILAKEIVERTNTTMKLEGQENSKERVTQSIEDMASDLKRTVARKLWD